MVACIEVLFMLAVAPANIVPFGILWYSIPTIFNSFAARSTFWLTDIVPNERKLLFNAQLLKITGLIKQ